MSNLCPTINPNSYFYPKSTKWPTFVNVQSLVVNKRPITATIRHVGAHCKLQCRIMQPILQFFWYNCIGHQTTILRQISILFDINVTEKLVLYRGKNNIRLKIKYTLYNALYSKIALRYWEHLMSLNEHFLFICHGALLFIGHSHKH